MTQSDVPSPPSGVPSAGFVRTMIAVAVGLVIVTLGLLYWGQVGSAEPRSMLVVRGDAEYADAQVTLEGPTVPIPLTGVISEANGFSIGFVVQAGIYDIQVTLKDGRSLRRGDVVVADQCVLTLDLSRGAITQQLLKPK